MTAKKHDGLKALAEQEAAERAEAEAKYANDPIKALAFKFLCLANEHIGKTTRIENIRALAKDVLA